MSVLITGGTGSFGHAMARTLLTQGCQRVVIYSRDEVKQDAMRVTFGDDPRLRFFLGDVRDKERLARAMHGIHTVYHAAALKRVPQAEYNPTEAIKTNILGTMHVCDAAIDAAVAVVVALSTDKATAPTNLYGATKLCLEKLVVASNAYAPGQTRLMCVRYGNVAGSRGSVIPLWREGLENRIPPTVTHPGMTRFWITLPEAVALAQRATTGQGGEVFIPLLSAYTVGELCAAVCSAFGGEGWLPNDLPAPCGLRPGEKMHELMLSEDELHLARDYGTHLCLHPTSPWVEQTDGQPVLAPVVSNSVPRLSLTDLQERLRYV